MYSPRLALATTVARVASWALRTVLHRNGETLPGHILLAIDSAALAKLSLGKKIILISGTNGKTSTTRTLAALMTQVPGAGKIATSKTGSNLRKGVAYALVGSETYAVLEVDELWLPIVIKEVNPAVVVLLNISRDQQHRTHEVKRIADKWREAALASDALFIGNIDDPFVNYILTAAKNSRRIAYEGGIGRHPDAAACPACGKYLHWKDGDYLCSCGLTNTLFDESYAHQGAVSRNTIIANVVAEIFGAPWNEVIASTFERKTLRTVMGRSLVLRLAKNPASMAEVLDSMKGDLILLVINSQGVDGLDVSWLWDVSFESLRGKQVVSTGERGLDLAYRLQVAGIECEFIKTIDQAITSFDPGSTIEVLASYSAFVKMETL